MKTRTHFGQSLVLTALALAVLISCSAEGDPGSGQTPNGGGGDGKVLVSNMGDLQPPFDETVLTGYEVEVPAGTSQIGFSYGDEEVPELQVSGEITGDENPYTVTLEINGEQKNYEITVIVMPSANITAITLSADDFTGENAITINNPADEIAQSAPYLGNPQPITVALTLSDAAATPTYGGNFQTWTAGSLSNAIAVTVGATVSGSITITTTKDIAGHERVTSREYTVSISRPDRQALAEGGVVEFIPVGEGTYDEVHVFTNATDTLTFYTQPNITNASLLVVAGGGGGGAGYGGTGRFGGGGGAGGLVYYNKDWTLNQLSYAIQVGAGGTKASGDNDATNGGDSIFGTTVTVKGGGKGASHNRYTAGSGGSGGGGTNADASHTSVKTGGSPQPATLPGGDAATHSFGYKGGTITANANFSACGGGGAGAAAVDIGAPSSGSAGGKGKEIDIEKTGEKWYAGGGNAGTVTSSGGAWTTTNGATENSDAAAGTPHTGNGGGGGFDKNNHTAGGDGGSGIVVVRFPFNY